MTDSQPCPSRESLVQLVTGELRGEPLETLCDHVDACEQCQHTLDTIEECPSEIARQFVGVTASALDLASTALDADTQAITAQAGWLSDLKSQHAGNPEPTLPLPCDLRQYRVTRLIGHGGMGEVYEALHTSLKRRVALKVIKRIRLDDPVVHGYFVREIEAAGQLDHPNLVRAYDAWEQDGYLFLTQELLDGDSLQTLATRGRFVSPEDVLDALVPICRGIEQLHSHGLLHRDIKPANIMQLRDGTIKLIDYGLAIASGDDAVARGPRAGTVGYMSPEQAQGNRPLDVRSDLFAVGCVLQYLLKHLPPVSGNEREPNLRRLLQDLAGRLTRARPEDRPQTMAGVRVELEQLRQEFPRTSPTTGTGASGSPRSGMLTDSPELSPTQSPARFGRFLAGLIVLAVLGSLWWLWRAPTGEPGPQSPASSNPVNGTGKPAPAADPGPATVKPAVDKPARKPFVLQMIEIPAGEFAMGGVPDDPKLMAIETPQRVIVFPEPFRMSACEITVGQFREFVDATGYVTEAVESGVGGWLVARNTSFSIREPQFHWLNPGHELTDELPVSMITYRDALAFCDWLSQREQQPYRLPTEAEWEYCCRAGDPAVFYFPVDRRNDYAWTIHNLGDHLTPRPVGTRRPNAWGLFDMIGNVREWCLDWYSPTAYSDDPVEFPAGPPTGKQRVIRGACFMDSHLFLRSSNRGYLDPINACQNQGFRVVQAGQPVLQRPVKKEVPE